MHHHISFSSKNHQPPFKSHNIIFAAKPQTLYKTEGDSFFQSKNGPQQLLSKGKPER